VHIPRSLSHDNAVGKQLARFILTADAGQELSKLEISGDVSWIRFEKFLKVKGGGRIVAEFHAFERESVAGKCVRRFIGDELLERFSARLLCLGHGLKERIIAVADSCAKRKRVWFANRNKRSEIRDEAEKGTREAIHLEAIARGQDGA
jgi:hypothetical protein